jgi:hypothetical protein
MALGERASEVTLGADVRKKERNSRIEFRASGWTKMDESATFDRGELAESVTLSEFVDPKKRERRSSSGDESGRGVDRRSAGSEGTDALDSGSGFKKTREPRLAQTEGLREFGRGFRAREEFAEKGRGREFHVI